MKKTIILTFLILSTLLSISLPLQGQTKDKDAELYYYWQQTRNKDSYHKAYQNYQADSAHNTPALKLSPKSLELEALSYAFTEAFWTEKDYDKTFYIALQLEEKLPQISEKEYPYLTLDMLAAEMNVQRNSLSRAVNRIAGVIFPVWVSSYRIAEIERQSTCPKTVNAASPF